MNPARDTIGWCEFTWNPMVGCLGGCSYCYARGQAKRQKHRCQKCYDFKPHLHPERLKEPMRRKKPSLIFADSMSDTFGEGVYPPWRFDILETMRKCPQHVFQDLTKRPDLIPRYDYPPNLWVGVSIEGNRWDRVTTLGRALQAYGIPHGFVSIEPFLWMVSDLNIIDAALRDAGIEWVIIGALTKRGRYAGGAPYNWVKEVVEVCRGRGIPVFVKRNCGYRSLPMEFPKEMKALLEER